LKKGSDINLIDEFGWTPLHYAAENGQVEIVKLLIEKGSDINLQDKYGRTLFQFATSTGNIEIIKLIQKGSEIR